MTKKKDVELDDFAKAQHEAFVRDLGEQRSDADAARLQAGNLAEGGLVTHGELEVIKAADVDKDSADKKGKES